MSGVIFIYNTGKKRPHVENNYRPQKKSDMSKLIQGSQN